MKTIRPAAALLFAIILLALTFPARARGADDYVWWEGEDAAEHNYNMRTFNPGWFDHPDALSGGKWLNTGGRRGADEVFARWRVAVPKDANYFFYARKFWHHGPFKWRFDNGAWHEVGRVGLLENVGLAKNITASWASLGRVELKAGAHTFEIRLLARQGENCPSAFDCFVLTPAPFTPSGKLKPGEKSGKAMPGFWAFEPDPDPFTDCPIDLRGLNDRVAGERGFLRRRGLDLVFERDPRPQRFWAVNVGTNVLNMDAASVDYLARMLAKYGVNMVRVHGAMWDRSAADLAKIDTALLGKLHYFVAALKKEGIYTELSFYFPLWFDVRPEFGLPGYEKTQNKKPFALLFFHPRMQEIYRSWARGLLRTVNPHTGLALADDPAVALVEVINEDNYFFWTFNPGRNIPYEAIVPLEERFGAWAARKHGSLAAAGRAWGARNRRDDFARGRAGLLSVWNLTAAGLKASPGTKARAADQARFLTEDLRAFYEATQKWFRDELGVKCPIVATNWKVADATLLGALDKYTNMACDVLDRHEYNGALHETPRGYTLTKGDKYRDECQMFNPRAMRELQYDGWPSCVSEFSFPMINRYRTDAPFLAAVYGGLQGVDCVVFFSVGGPGWRNQLTKWPLMTPATLGQFPACALAYRRGDVPEAPTVVRQVLDLDALMRLEGSGTAEPESIDSLRAKEVPPGGVRTGGAVSNIDPLAYYVGRVVRSFGKGGGGPAVLADLSAFIDRDGKTVRSARGEAAWNWGKGFAVVDTPRAQGVTGMLKAAGEVKLGDVTIASGNDYGCVMVVSLDGKPLRESERMLLQVMTDEMNYGWKTRPAKSAKGEAVLEVVDLGGPPLNVRNAAGTVTLRRPDAARLAVVALDANGYPAGAAEGVRREGVHLSISLSSRGTHYFLQETSAN